MGVKTVRFNKASLSNLVREGTPVVVKDSIERGLRFKVGKKRSVFQYEKRISGGNSAAVTFTIGAFPAISIEDARQEARRLCTLCEKGVDPRDEKKERVEADLTLGKCIEVFHKEKEEQGVIKKQRNKYRGFLKKCIPKEWLSRPMTSIDSPLIVERFKEIHKDGTKNCWLFLKVFSNLWNTCKPLPFALNKNREEILGENPIPGSRKALRSFKKKAPKRVVVGKHHLGKFLVVLERLCRSKRSISRVRSCQIYTLTLFTGMRVCEARALTWDRVDLESGVIFLDRTKNMKSHYVPLSSFAWAFMEQLREESPEAVYVFPSSRNRNKPTNLYQQATVDVREGLKGPFEPYACRRTFASIANDVGIGHLTLKRMLNHHYQGDVTGGYVVPSFNPGKERVHFQKICDYLLERKAEYLGEQAEEENVDEAKARALLSRTVLSLGLSFERARELLLEVSA